MKNMGPKAFYRHTHWSRADAYLLQQPQ